jgi:hypothetical protein
MFLLFFIQFSEHWWSYSKVNEYTKVGWVLNKNPESGQFSAWFSQKH